MFVMCSAILAKMRHAWGYVSLLQAMKLAYDASNRLYKESDEDNITVVITRFVNTSELRL